jgi:hypothetical protein
VHLKNPSFPISRHMMLMLETLHKIHRLQMDVHKHSHVMVAKSAFIPFVSFGDLDNNTFKGLTSLLSVEQEIQYDECWGLALKCFGLRARQHKEC